MYNSTRQLSNALNDPSNRVKKLKLRCVLPKLSVGSPNPPPNLAWRNSSLHPFLAWWVIHDFRAWASPRDRQTKNLIPPFYLHHLLGEASVKSLPHALPKNYASQQPYSCNSLMSLTPKSHHLAPVRGHSSEILASRSPYKFADQQLRNCDSPQSPIIQVWIFRHQTHQLYIILVINQRLTTIHQHIHIIFNHGILNILITITHTRSSSVDIVK